MQLMPRECVIGARGIYGNQADNGVTTMPSLNITKVIREHHAIDLISTGSTVGENIDKMLLEAATNGTEIQTIAIEFEKEDWQQFAKTYEYKPTGTNQHKPPLKSKLAY